MINCTDNHNLIIDNHYDELTVHDKDRMLSHIRDCHECAKFQNDIEAIRTITTADRISVTAEFAIEVQSHIQDHEVPLDETPTEISVADIMQDLAITPSDDFASRVSQSIADLSTPPATLTDDYEESLILDYALDQLDEDDCKILEHTSLQKEPALSQLAEIRATLDMVKELGNITVSAGFADRVAASIAAHSDANIETDCDAVQAALVDYIFGEVSDLQESSIYLHFKHCYTCKETYDELNTAINNARLLGHLQISSDLVQQVSEKITEHLEREKILEEALGDRYRPLNIFQFTKKQIKRIPVMSASVLIHLAAIALFMIINKSNADPITGHMPRGETLQMGLETEQDRARLLPTEFLQDDTANQIIIAAGDGPTASSLDLDEEDNSSMYTKALVEEDILIVNYKTDEIETVELESDQQSISYISESLASSFLGQRLSSNRRRVLARYSALEADDALRSGFKFLAQQQLSTGAWPIGGEFGGADGHQVGVTALALLSYTGCGFNHQSDGLYGETMIDGFTYLLSQQDENGFFGAKFNGVNNMYAHAIATQALLEDMALSDDNRWQAEIELALRAIITAQLADGSWAYTADDRASGDTSISYWQMQALLTAYKTNFNEHSNLRRKDIDASLKKALSYLKTLRDKKTSAMSYRYKDKQHYGPHALTAADLFVRKLCDNVLKNNKLNVLPKRKNKKQAQLLMQTPARASSDEDTLTDPNKPNYLNNNYYYWYYASHALFQYDQKKFKIWSKNMSETLLSLQISEGKFTGSWPAENSQYGKNGGTVYNTAMALLALEVYFRYPIN